MIYEKWGNARFKYRNRSFWCRGYYVDTVGKNTKKIKEYIANQIKEDRASEQLVFDPASRAHSRKACARSACAGAATSAWPRPASSRSARQRRSTSHGWCTG